MLRSGASNVASAALDALLATVTRWGELACLPASAISTREAPIPAAKIMKKSVLSNKWCDASCARRPRLSSNDARHIGAATQALRRHLQGYMTFGEMKWSLAPLTFFSAAEKPWCLSRVGAAERDMMPRCIRRRIVNPIATPHVRAASATGVERGEIGEARTGLRLGGGAVHHRAHPPPPALGSISMWPGV